MKQIRLNNSVMKIESCKKCPLCDVPYWHCSLGVKLYEEDIVANTTHTQCPLEDIQKPLKYEDRAEYIIEQYMKEEGVE